MGKLKTLLLLVILLIQAAYAQERILAVPDTISPKNRICFALYTVHENTLKLTAQFYPIKNYEPFEAFLEIEEQGAWKQIATAEIIYPGYTAPFRVTDWDDTKKTKYRVVHNQTAFYEGVIQKNPKDKDEFVMAAFTCNSIYPEHGGDIPRTDLVENMKRLRPDLLFFSGDQVYDHSEHYASWLKFGQDFGEVIRNTPTICIPDDHDIGQANLWGASGKKAKTRRGISGGYYMPASYVNEVQRAQTSHLPDPYDPTPVAQNISVYYTDLTWGGISFAILEDRKFKSGLEGVIEHKGEVFEAILDSTVDTKSFDVPNTNLLGERQLHFLEDWTTDWKDAQLKTVLSQTIFSMANNYSGKRENEIYADFDTNGWPQTGRDKALSVIRKSFSTMVAGDQHLGTVVQHGIDRWGDAGYSFCTPAIANLWLRWWQPKAPGNNRKKGAPSYTGDFLDGFQNKMTVLAAANPTLPERKEGGKLSTRAAGFGVVRYHKPSRNITFECWGRNVDLSEPSAKQYPGWPITINQKDNFKLDHGFELPTLILSKTDQVVTVKETGTGRLCSSLRISGTTYQPKVLKEGDYTIELGEGNNKEILRQVTAKKKHRKKLKVIF